VNDEFLKITAYFDERQRTADRFTADALLDLYGDAAVATSVMLRGISGFGLHQVLRSDETLSTSEDPPVTIIAVDTTDKIAGLAEKASSMVSRGLFTLERAQLVTPSTEPVPHDTTRLTVYVGRRHRVAGRPAHYAVCDVLHRHGFFGATVFLGVDGTAHGERRRARFFSSNAEVPVIVIAVGTGDRVKRVLPELKSLLPNALLTVERAQLCKRGGEFIAAPAPVPAQDADGHGLWQKLMVQTSEADLHNGHPIHRALVHRLRDSKSASGVTVLRGVWGFRGDREPQGDKLIQLGRQVPVNTIIIDTPERIAASFPIVDELTDRHGLVTCELVPALVSIDADVRRGSTQLARHQY